MTLIGEDWAFDTAYPAGNPAPIEIYVDGIWVKEVVTNIGRQDVANFVNNFGNFEAINHYVPAQWGWDYIGGGWAYDAEAAGGAPVNIRIYVDGALYKEMLADADRQNLIGYHGITTLNHGFNFGVKGLNSAVSHTVEARIVKSVGCSEVSLGYKTIPASVVNNIQQFIGDNIQIYPNSSNGIFNIQTGADKVLNATVIDMQGRKVFESNSIQYQIDLSTFKKGIYIVDLQFESKDIKKKIILN